MTTPTSTNASAWQMAIQQYLATIPDSQKAVFKAPANADSCLDTIIQAQARKRGFTRLMQLIRPVIEPLKRFEGAIDVLVQTHGGVASPIWGPLRMAITLASDHFKTLESLVMVLSRITSSLERFVNYEKLFQAIPAVQKAVGALYFDLIDFCTRVTRYFSRSAVRLVGVSFDRDFREISDKITFHSSEIDQVANAANMTETKSAREEEQAAKYLRQRIDIQRWLSPSNVQDDLYRHQLEYMPGSCDWILDTKQFQAYINSPISTTMRIRGRPGTGKTVLASFLVKYLMEHQKGCVVYFFCKANESEKRTANSIHRTLLAQLLHHDYSLYDVIEPFYVKSGRVVADSFVDTCSVLRLMFSKVSLPGITIIIDALDECENIEDLMRILFDIRTQSSSRIKLIVTSREMNISFTFDENVVFEGQSSHQPIRKYSEHRLGQMNILSDPVLNMMIVRQISNAADGLWLYARLMLDEIARLPSAELIRRHLRSVPQGITQLYTQILRVRESTFTPVELMFAQQIYLWIDVGNYMPTFLHADYLPYDTLSLILQHCNFGQPVFDPIDLVTNLCSPLIKACDFEDEASCEVLHDYEISAIHHTADQYIQNSQDLLAIDLPVVLKPRRLRQLYRGATAVWYYTQCDVSWRSLKTYHNHLEDRSYGSYFEMSYALWGALRFEDLPHNLESNEITEAIRLMDIMVGFIHPAACKCLRWIESAIIINYAGVWIQLWENAADALALVQAQRPFPQLPTMESYRRARITFLTDYEYVLRITGPSDDYVDADNVPTPQGFENRPLGIEMLAIGRKWQYLHEPSAERRRMQKAQARLIQTKRQEGLFAPDRVVSPQQMQEPNDDVAAKILESDLVQRPK